jgi:hypothetical protein
MGSAPGLPEALRVRREKFKSGSHGSHPLKRKKLLGCFGGLFVQKSLRFADELDKHDRVKGENSDEWSAEGDGLFRSVEKVPAAFLSAVEGRYVRGKGMLAVYRIAGAVGKGYLSKTVILAKAGIQTRFPSAKASRVRPQPALGRRGGLSLSVHRLQLHTPMQQIPHPRVPPLWRIL